MAEALGQVPPRNAGLGYIQNRIDEQPIVAGGPTRVLGAAWQKIFDALPIGIRNGVAVSHSRPSVAQGADRPLPESPKRCPHDLVGVEKRDRLTPPPCRPAPVPSGRTRRRRSGTGACI